MSLAKRRFRCWIFAECHRLAIGALDFKSRGWHSKPKKSNISKFCFRFDTEHGPTLGHLGFFVSFWKCCWIYREPNITVLNTNSWLWNDYDTLVFIQGRRPRGDWGTVPPKFEVGDGPCIGPPNILRSSVVGWAQKLEDSKIIFSHWCWLAQLWCNLKFGDFIHITAWCYHCLLPLHINVKYSVAQFKGKLIRGIVYISLIDVRIIHKRQLISKDKLFTVRHGGVAVCSVPCNRKVTGSNLPQATV